MSTKQYFDTIKSVLDLVDLDSLDRCIDTICSFVNCSNKILICGNGGSASTASHYVTDWVKMSLVLREKKLNAICLSDNIGMLTAYANDVNYDDVYSKQVESYGDRGDLLIVVSGSGNSKNILKAVQKAKKLQMRTIAVVGYDGGQVLGNVDEYFHVPSFDMQICEDVHLMFGHMVMKALVEDCKGTTSTNIKF